MAFGGRCVAVGVGAERLGLTVLQETLACPLRDRSAATILVVITNQPKKLKPQSTGQAHHRLTSILPGEEPQERTWRGVEPVVWVLQRQQPTVREPAIHHLACERPPVHPVEDDKALHADTARDQRSRNDLGESTLRVVRVVSHRTATYDPPVLVHSSQHRLKDASTDVVEVDVDPFGHAAFKSARKVSLRWFTVASKPR